MSNTGAASVENTGASGPIKVAWSAAAVILLVWVWALYAFSDYWINFEQYAYGWLVPFLGIFFFWRRLGMYGSKIDLAASPIRSRDDLTGMLLLVLLAASTAPLEFWHQRDTLSRTRVLLIGFQAVAVTLLCLGWMGGRKLRREMLFPTVFFLMAAPWISAIEEPVTAGLAEKVSAVITEMMHWLGIHAQRNGVTITMKAGPVGVDEACSGIRSLQSGRMYGVALGELFLLTVPRRLVMVAAAFTFAVVLNICRTFILCWQVDAHGMDQLDKVHDMVGGAMSLVLPLMLFAAAWLLRKEEIALAGPARTALAAVSRRISHGWLVTAAVVLIAGGFIGVNGWLWRESLKMPEQTTPNLAVRESPSIIKSPVPEATLKILTPEPKVMHLLKLKSDIPGERDIGGYYFFWVPNKANGFLLGHRPDVCMAGAGWRKDGETESIKLAIDGKEMDFYKFLWKQGEQRAVQIWGIWRNGQTVPINYRELNSASAVSWLDLGRKRGSATELVSINMLYEETVPDLKALGDAMNKLVQYRGQPASK